MLWRDALRSDGEHEPVFSPLGEERYALGLETIYEGYLVHYGSSRLFAPPDADTALLLGDYLYAQAMSMLVVNKFDTAMEIDLELVDLDGKVTALPSKNR